MPSEEDISAQWKLLVAHRRTLAAYLERQAGYGGRFATPVEVLNGISEARDNIVRIKAILRGWSVEVDDLPDDVVLEPLSAADSQFVEQVRREEWMAHIPLDVWPFWIRWIFATAMAGLLGYGILWDIATRLVMSIAGSVDLPLSLALFWAAFWTAVGVGQWLVLLWLHTKWATGWIIASTAGGLASALIYWTINTSVVGMARAGIAILFWAVMWAIIWALASAPQWLVLRQQVRNAEHWVIANAVSGAAFGAGGVLFRTVVGMVVVALITMALLGYVLTRLLDHTLSFASTGQKGISQTVSGRGRNTNK